MGEVFTLTFKWVFLPALPHTWPERHCLERVKSHRVSLASPLPVTDPSWKCRLCVVDGLRLIRGFFSPCLHYRLNFSALWRESGKSGQFWQPLGAAWRSIRSCLKKATGWRKNSYRCDIFWEESLKPNEKARSFWNVEIKWRSSGDISKEILKTRHCSNKV